MSSWVKYFAAQIENWYFDTIFSHKTDCRTRISRSESIPLRDNPKIWQNELCFFEKLQQTAGLKVVTYKFFEIIWNVLWFQHKNLTLTVMILYSKIEIQRIASGVKGMLIKAEFLPKYTIFKILGCTQLAGYSLLQDSPEKWWCIAMAFIL